MANMFAFWGNLTTNASTAYATGGSTMPEGTGRQKITLLSLQWGGDRMVDLDVGDVMYRDLTMASNMDPIIFTKNIDDTTPFLMMRWYSSPVRGETVEFTVVKPGRDNKGYRRVLNIQTQGTQIVGLIHNTREVPVIEDWEVIYNKIVFTFWYEHIGGGREMGGQIVYKRAKGSG